jgi:hypothetical protein
MLIAEGGRGEDRMEDKDLSAKALNAASGLVVTIKKHQPRPASCDWCFLFSL